VETGATVAANKKKTSENLAFTPPIRLRRMRRRRVLGPRHVLSSLLQGPLVGPFWSLNDKELSRAGGQRGREQIVNGPRAHFLFGRANLRLDRADGQTCGRLDAS
jgi:hypothetical protein